MDGVGANPVQGIQKGHAFRVLARWGVWLGGYRLVQRMSVPCRRQQYPSSRFDSGARFGIARWEWIRMQPTSERQDGRCFHCHRTEKVGRQHQNLKLGHYREIQNGQSRETDENIPYAVYSRLLSSGDEVLLDIAPRLLTRFHRFTIPLQTCFGLSLLRH